VSEEVTCIRGKYPKESDVLLITADGKTLPDDLDLFLTKGIVHDVMCIGRSIRLYPGHVHHYVDVDADAGKWVADNLEKNHPARGPIFKHTLGDVPWFDGAWEITNCPINSEDILWHGSSAYFGALIGLAMGYENIVLAGCPMDSKGHWYNPDETWGPRWTMETYQVWFEFAATPESKRVKSLSGYTKQLLGGLD